MQTKDWWYLIATIVSPFLAAFLTLQWQNRKEKRDAKMQLFSTLMKYRRIPLYLPPAQEWVCACQLIDVVFARDEKVMAIWRELLPLWQGEKPAPNQGHKFIELLSAMASTLGFRDIQQTDIDKAYNPAALTKSLDTASAIQTEFLRVLKTTNALMVDPVYQKTEMIDPARKPAVQRGE